jgi:hypothetical protein
MGIPTGDKTHSSFDFSDEKLIIAKKVKTQNKWQGNSRKIRNLESDIKCNKKKMN